MPRLLHVRTHAHACVPVPTAPTLATSAAGDLLNKYLYLTGKVDMHAVEVTIQNLISHGLDPKLENNPYLCFVYTSFQVGMVGGWAGIMAKFWVRLSWLRSHGIGAMAQFP